MLRPAKLLLFFLACALPLAAQQFRFSHFTIKDGLSQNTVNCILKDSEGYYWFGTQDGLNRFDGYSVKVFRNERGDTTTISDNFVLALAEDAFGNLWIGTRNGLNRYDKRANRFTRIWLDPREKNDFHCTVPVVLADQNGNILFNSIYTPCGRIDKEDAAATPFRIVNDPVRLLQPSTGQGYACYNKESGALEGYSLSGIRQWQLGKAWIAGGFRVAFGADVFVAGNGMMVKRGGEKDFIPVFGEFASKAVSCAFFDRRQCLWIGTSEGLYLVKDQRYDRMPVRLIHNAGDRTSIGSNGIEGVYEDRDGLVWVGTSEGGANCYDPQKEVFMAADHHTPLALAASQVWAILQEQDELWVGTGGGLDRFITTGGRFSAGEGKIVPAAVNDQLKSSFITCLEKDGDGNLWVGVHNKGIAICNKTTGALSWLNKENSPLRSAIVHHILRDAENNMWLSTQAGIYCYRSKEKKMEAWLPVHIEKGGLPSGYIMNTYQDRQGTIWACSTAGLYRLNKTTNTFSVYASRPSDTTSLSYNIVTSCYEDSKGRFWIGTLGGGIDLMDRGKGTFRTFTKKNGLANDVCYRMLEDQKGRLWISTNNGLSCFDPQRHTFINYSTDDGIISNEFTQNAASKNAAGQLFFGSPEGLLVFDPAQLADVGADIPIVLTGLKVNYEDRQPSASLGLYYGENTATFEFAAPDFRRRHKLEYAFRLDGFDQDWHAAPASRIASFTNLPFGDYTFRVRARVAGGAWQEKQLAVSVRVIPPFWLRGWFVALEIISALALIVALVKYYSQRRLKARLREIEVQHKIQVERERISRDLHDHVGSNLTYIISSLDNIGDKIEGLSPEQAQQKIGSLGEFTRSTMQQLRETIWVINKEAVTVAEFREKAREHILKMISASGRCEFELKNEGNDSVLIKPSQAISLFRILQEAVNNAMKHSGAGRLVLTVVSDAESGLTIEIADNGKGMKRGITVDGHYGLLNMRSRAEEMGAGFVLQSEEGKGTTVKVTAPL